MFSERGFHYFIILTTLVLTIVGCNRTGTLELSVVNPQGIDDLYQFEDSLIKPVDYLNLISLEELPVEERKVIFIRQLLPTILVCKYNLEVQKKFIQMIAGYDSVNITRKQRRTVDSLFVKYRTNNLYELIEKLHTHPVSIVLAQAALESAWGTSRFYSEGNNVFGVWSFSESDDRIPSKGQRDGKPVFLKKYQTLSASVEDYFLVLARGPFEGFRNKRMESFDPYSMVDYLIKYSESGDEYPRQLKQIIKKNHLTQYDYYRIDPNFIK